MELFFSLFSTTLSLVWPKVSSADFLCYHQFKADISAPVTVSYAQRPIVVRHRQYAMIRPSADILALNLVDIPFKFVTIFFFDLILYFMSGLQVSASQFFIFILFTFVANLAMLALFRSLASSNRHEAKATMFAGFVKFSLLFSSFESFELFFDALLTCFP